jgi:ankyrin repeat protein
MEETPLHKANDPEEVRRLLDAGWSVDCPGWMGATPLHSAAERGLPDVARSLIRRGANVNARRPERADMPLHFAANTAVASLLIEAGAEVDGLDRWAAPRCTGPPSSGGWMSSISSSVRAPGWTGLHRMEPPRCTGPPRRAMPESSNGSCVQGRG